MRAETTAQRIVQASKLEDLDLDHGQASTLGATTSRLTTGSVTLVTTLDQLINYTFSDCDSTDFEIYWIPQ